MLYFNAREGRLRLRFQLGALPGHTQENMEATFVGDKAGQPLLTAQATLSVASEYRVDAELSEDLARDWEPLRVTDRMPFRLILRAPPDRG